MTADQGPGEAVGFEAATGGEEAPAQTGREREAAVQAAFEGLQQIRRLMNVQAASPLAMPAVWELHQPVRAIALSLEAAGIPPSAIDANGQRTATGYCVTPAEPPAVVRVEWLGPPGSGAPYEAQAAVQRCAAVLRRLGWETLEYRGPRRHRYLEVEARPRTAVSSALAEVLASAAASRTQPTAPAGPLPLRADTPALLRFPPCPIRGVRVLHQRQNCAPHFAEIVVDFEPAAEGCAFEVAEGLTVEYEPAGDLPRFFAAVAAGIREQLSLPEHGVVAATQVVLRQARAETFGSHELAFKIAGYLAARKALQRTGVPRLQGAALATASAAETSPRTAPGDDSPAAQVRGDT